MHSAEYLKIITRNLKDAGRRKRPREILVTPQDVMEVGDSQNWKCALSGTPLEHTPGGRKWGGRVCNPNICSIDRIDNTLGYVKGNIQLVTWAVNQAKGTLSNAEFKQVCSSVVNMPVAP